MKGLQGTEQEAISEHKVIAPEHRQQRDIGLTSIGVCAHSLRYDGEVNRVWTLPVWYVPRSNAVV